MIFEVIVQEDQRKALMAIDKSIREKIIKRITRMRNEPPGRHLKLGLDYFVESVGQFRIIYIVEDNRKEVYFIGDHKEYERWYKRSGN
ncbi:MAG: hypothetical protein V1909_05980 [Candidatus Micrarchaeota archaeon]